jgi:hypothetical protein
VSAEKTDHPTNEATIVANDMLAVFEAADMPPEARVIVLITIPKGECGSGSAGYHDDHNDAQMFMDLMMHLRAVARANGKELHVMGIQPRDGLKS